MSLEENISEERSRAPRLSRDYRLEQIREAMGAGASSVKEIAKRVGISLFSIYHYAHHAGIELPKCKRGRKPGSTRADLSQIDEGIKKGLSYREIGEMAGIVGRRVGQMIEQSGRREEYLKNRRWGKAPRIREEKKQISREVAWFLDRRAEELAKQEGWEYEKAVEYLNKYFKPRHSGPKTRLKTHTFDELVTLFRNYKEAKDKNEKLSLDELAEGTGYTFVYVGRILADVGLEPMYRKIEDRQVTPEHKKEAIKRAVKVKMPAPDIAYFLGLNEWVVSQNMKHYGLSDKRPKAPQVIRDFGLQKLTYRLASQIYEACDAGFTLEETCELLDTTTNVVEYAIRNDKKIEADIVKALRVLYNDKKIDKPYKKNEF